VSVRFREKKNRGRVSLLSRKKKDRRADFFKNGTGNYCSITLSLGRRRERETPTRVNSPPLEKAPREREEEEEEEERIALVDTQKTTLKNTSGGEE
jgi:hypothetical protein